MSDEMVAYFRERHHEAVRAMRDAHRAGAGDPVVLRRLLDAVSIEVTDERAALATQISEMVDVAEAKVEPVKGEEVVEAAATPATEPYERRPPRLGRGKP